MRQPSALSRSLGGKVTTTSVLVVGAGGIGCELLKNLVLTGFKKITIIDLDTIDVTNLNRQFLFHRKHVGMSKSKVARESALSFVPDADITAIHGSVTTSEYGVSFYKKFALVMNALDNRAARSHVNRMCLAADVPLVESGTAGYTGQVSVIRKGRTECYDCQPKPHQKTFPGCTIRNTPSEPIHCIVWSKHLFNQLFGEDDPDQDVSPDTEDPELAEGGDAADAGDKKEDGNSARISTKQWAIENKHDPKMIFEKLFSEDIRYLLTMDKLWAKRKPPTPLSWEQLEQDAETARSNEGGIRDQALWSLKQCRDVFSAAVCTLRDKLKASDFKDHLVWDKDDDAAMDFVAACSIFRSKVFNIPQKTRFDIKSMAGNIIPAIATTNAVIAGCIVMEVLKILNDEAERCREVWFSRHLNPRNRILVPCELSKPNPKCYVCADKNEVSVKVDFSKMTVTMFEDKILKGSLSMVAPDAEIDGTGTILINSEDDEETKAAGTGSKMLSEFLSDGSILICDDFLQEYNVRMILYNADDLEEEFQLVGDVENLKKEETNGGSNGNGKSAEESTDADDIQEIVFEEASATKAEAKKRPADLSNDAPSLKKARLQAASDEDIVCIE